MKVFFVLGIMAFALNGYCQTNLYISPKGKDSNSGSREMPLQTIQAALLKVKNADQPTVQLNLLKGTHYLQSALVINPSVLNGRRLLITAVPGESPVVSGAATISPKWKPWAGKGWQAFIGKGRKLDQLFCNGIALPMARYPNFDSSARFFNGTAADAVSKKRIQSWKAPAGGYIHALHQAEWGDFHYRITGKKGTDSLVMEGGWQNNRPSPMHAEHRFVENIREELDAPGEWFYEEKTGVLFLIAPKELDLPNTRFEVSVLDNLIEIKGDEGNPVEHVTISNIYFTGTNRSFMQPREPLLRSDWTINRNGAILIEGGKSIEIKNCSFRQLGGHALFISRYNRGITIQQNLIQQIGANAIAFVGDPNAVRSPLFRYEQTQTIEQMDLQAGPKSNNYPADCLVYDNLIHDIGLIEKQVAGVEISMSMNITVRNNTIYNVPRAGINIGDGCWGGHLIEFNDVFNTVLESGDHGAFNSWGRDRFWLPSIEAVDSLVAKYPQLPYLDVIKPIDLRNNRFHCEHGWDIDLDDGSSHYRIINNLCLNGGLKLREGFDRRVINNIILNNTFHPHVWYAESKDVFMHNIVTGPYAPIRINNWGLKVDSNFFIQPEGLEEAQKNKTDLNSRSGDPLFTNSGKGDFSLLPGSPAGWVGFRSFSTLAFGVVSPSLRSKAIQPIVKQLSSETMNEPGKTIEWLGATLKNIETLGEQSASGAPDKAGVLVVHVAKESLSAKNKLRPGDIIRTINGNKVTDLNQFLTLLQSLTWQGNVEAEILQEQQPLKLRIHLK